MTNLLMDPAMPNQTIPGANQSRRYERNYPGVTQPRITKLVLHSTETPNLPGYVNGATAPTATINPWPGQQAIWQHFPANMSGRALANPTGTTVSENRDDVAQIEIIGYSDSKIAAKYGVSAWDLERLPDEGYAYLANLIAWFCTEWDVPARIPDKPWPAYPASYGNSPARMSGAEYDAYTGILGHLHVSGNDHGDPKIDPVKLLRFVKAAIDPIRPDPKIVELQQELVAAGLLTPADVDGIDGPKTQAAQEAYEMTLANLETKLDAIETKLDTHATALDRIEAAIRAVPRAVAGFASNGRDLVTWMRLGAGAVRLTPEGTEVGILPPVPPLAADDVLSKPAKP